jgi:hypothetical protein
MFLPFLPTMGRPIQTMLQMPLAWLTCECRHHSPGRIPAAPGFALALVATGLAAIGLAQAHPSFRLLPPLASGPILRCQGPGGRVKNKPPRMVSKGVFVFLSESYG